jgi:hypothetical protein
MHGRICKSIALRLLGRPRHISMFGRRIKHIQYLSIQCLETQAYLDAQHICSKKPWKIWIVVESM